MTLTISNIYPLRTPTSKKRKILRLGLQDYLDNVNAHGVELWEKIYLGGMGVRSGRPRINVSRMTHRSAGLNHISPNVTRTTKYENATFWHTCHTCFPINHWFCLCFFLARSISSYLWSICTCVCIYRGKRWVLCLMRICKRFGAHTYMEDFARKGNPTWLTSRPTMSDMSFMWGFISGCSV